MTTIWYGPEHIWDLVLARQFSRADLVGKARENVYLAACDTTLRCDPGRGEIYGSRFIAGGALLVSREALARVGGWRRLPSGVDVALIAAVLRAGGRIYRTHGAGFIYVRNGTASAWQADDSYFLATADGRYEGFRPEFADLEVSAGEVRQACLPARSAAPRGAGLSGTDGGAPPGRTNGAANTASPVAAFGRAWRYRTVHIRRRFVRPPPYKVAARQLLEQLGAAAPARVVTIRSARWMWPVARWRPRGRAAAWRGLVGTMLRTAPSSAHREVAEALAEALESGRLAEAERMAATASRTPVLRAEKILSRRHGYLWICNPKVASRSLIAALLAADPKALLIRSLSVAEVFAVHPEARDYLSFAFVRHPYERTYSGYADAGHDGRKRRDQLRDCYGISAEDSFSAWCAWLVSPFGADAFADIHWMSQDRAIRLADDRLPDFVGRHDRLEADLARVLARLGVPMPELPVRNRLPGTLLTRRAVEAERSLRAVRISAANKALLRQRYAADSIWAGSRLETAPPRHRRGRRTDGACETGAGSLRLSEFRAPELPPVRPHGPRPLGRNG